MSGPSINSISSTFVQPAVGSTGGSVPVATTSVPQQAGGLVGVAATLPGPNAARTVAAQRNPVPNTTLHGAGRSGVKAFFAAIGNKIKSIFSRPQPSYQLPASISHKFANGKTAVMDGSQFDSMIKALPKSQRAAAAATLPGVISSRIRHGENLYHSAVNDTPPPTNPTPKDVADLILFLRAKASANGDDFTHGAMSIEDPGGKLLAYLKSSRESYARSSSHLRGIQIATLPDGDRNIQRGIDITPGTEGLPCGHKTTVFGAIPQIRNESQRLFLKTESHGCRYSTLSHDDAVAARAGSGGVDRPKRSGDFRDAIGHTFSFLATRGKGRAGSRKEHLPGSVKTAYKATVKALKESPYYKSFGGFLELSQASVGGYGLRSLRTILNDMKLDPNYSSGLAAMLKPLEDEIANFKYQDHPTIRLGSEVILQSTDF